jgi:signal transduction histidine kinase
MGNIALINASSELNTRTSLSPASESDRRDNSHDFLHLRKMAALGELASGITHDFRNILQTIISTLELVANRSDRPMEVQRLVASALVASERGVGLSNRILAFSRCDAPEVTPGYLPLSLESVTETLARTVGAGTKVRFEDTPADLWQVAINLNELELALINLGINARDAMPGGGSIRLGAQNVTIPQVDRRVRKRPLRHDGTERRGPPLPLLGGDYVMVTVDDTGSGMDAATLALAVKPFFTTKPVGKGTGLGLAMAHTLVTESGGALRLTSELGQGTTVELWLRRAVVPTAG